MNKEVAVKMRNKEFRFKAALMALVIGIANIGTGFAYAADNGQPDGNLLDRDFAAVRQKARITAWLPSF